MASSSFTDLKAERGSLGPLSPTPAQAAAERTSLGGEGYRVTSSAQSDSPESPSRKSDKQLAPLNSAPQLELGHSGTSMTSHQSHNKSGSNFSTAQLLLIFRELLSLHESKLCMLLLDHFVKSGLLANATLPFPGEALQSSIDEFVRRNNDSCSLSSLASLGRLVLSAQGGLLTASNASSGSPTNRTCSEPSRKSETILDQHTSPVPERHKESIHCTDRVFIAAGLESLDSLGEPSRSTLKLESFDDHKESVGGLGQDGIIMLGSHAKPSADKKPKAMETGQLTSSRGSEKTATDSWESAGTASGSLQVPGMANRAEMAHQSSKVNNVKQQSAAMMGASAALGGVGGGGGIKCEVESMKKVPSIRRGPKSAAIKEQKDAMQGRLGNASMNHHSSNKFNSFGGDIDQMSKVSSKGVSSRSSFFKRAGSADESLGDGCNSTPGVGSSTTSRPAEMVNVNSMQSDTISHHLQMKENLGHREKTYSPSSQQYGPSSHSRMSYVSPDQYLSGAHRAAQRQSKGPRASQMGPIGGPIGGHRASQMGPIGGPRASTFDNSRANRSSQGGPQARASMAQTRASVAGGNSRMTWHQSKTSEGFLDPIDEPSNDQKKKAKSSIKNSRVSNFGTLDPTSSTNSGDGMFGRLKAVVGFKAPEKPKLTFGDPSVIRQPRDSVMGNGGVTFGRDSENSSQPLDDYDDEEEDDDPDDDVSDDMEDEDWFDDEDHRASWAMDGTEKKGCGFNLKIEEKNSKELAKATGCWIIHPNRWYRMLWDFFSFIAIITESITIPFTIPWEEVLQASGKAGTLDLSRIARFTKLIRIARLARLLRLKALLQRLQDNLPSTSLILSLLNTLGFFALLCHWSACMWGFLGNPEKVGHETAGLPPYKYEECGEGGGCEVGIVGSPWIRRFAMETFDPKQQYMTALYFATGTITGGETGIAPGYWVEQIFVVLMMILSFLVCSVILSEIVVVMQKMNADTAELQDNMRGMKEFMGSRKVPLALQTKVKRYLEFQYKSQRSGLIDRYAFFDQLSPWLRLELTEFLNSDVLCRHPFFTELPRRVFKRMCGLANIVLYAPGDIVVQRGHRAACMCFIVQGRLRILRVQDGPSEAQEDPPSPAFTPGRRSSDSDEKASSYGSIALSEMSHSMKEITEEEDDFREEVTKVMSMEEEENLPDVMTQAVGYRSVSLESPSYFGDSCLFQEDQVRLNTVVAVTHVELLTVGREAVQDVLHEFPKVMRVYDRWSQHMMHECQEATRCQRCNKLGHSAINCPYFDENGLPHGQAAQQAAEQPAGDGFEAQTSTFSEDANKRKSLVNIAWDKLRIGFGPGAKNPAGPVPDSSRPSTNSDSSDASSVRPSTNSALGTSMQQVPSTLSKVSAMESNRSEVTPKPSALKSVSAMESNRSEVTPKPSALKSKLAEGNDVTEVTPKPSALKKLGAKDADEQPAKSALSKALVAKDADSQPKKSALSNSLNSHNADEGGGSQDSSRMPPGHRPLDEEV